MRPFIEPEWAAVPADQLRVARESQPRPYLEATDPEVATGYVAEANGLLGFAPRLEPQPQSSAFLGSLRAPYIFGRGGDGPQVLTIWVPADDKTTRTWRVAGSVDAPLTIEGR
jgi:hypothetical protein